MAISSPGIGSNLDVNSIVTQLMQVESQPLTTLARKEASIQAKISAFGSLQGALSSFQSALSGLSDAGRLQPVLATPADTNVLGATATASAAVGSYSVDVARLAQAQSLYTAGQASTTAAIGAGGTTTLTFQFGTIVGTATNGIYAPGATFTQNGALAMGSVTIDSTNNSLEGIRDAINAANLGVTATLVSDGDETVPHHLVLTSTRTGAATSMKIGVSGDAAIAALLAHDPAGTQGMTESVAAQDATLTVNGIAVRSATNTVTGAIQGVSLSLAKVGATTVAVAQDAKSVTTAINAFVKGYNDLHAALKTLTSYNPETRQAGPLLGDTAVPTLQAQLRAVLGSPLPGSGGVLSRLSQIGVTIQTDGTMAVDAAKLQSAVSGNFGDLARLFATVGKATDRMAAYAGSTTATRAGTYSLQVTALATQGTLTGNVDLRTGPVTIAAGTEIDATLDGVTARVALVAGTYTESALAAMVQSAINGTAAFSSATASVSASIDSNGFLQLRSARWGSASAVALADAAGTPVATLLGAGASAVAGTDVAGTIGGVAAVGSGQTLTGQAGTPAEGLKITITGGALGDRGSVEFGFGYAAQLSRVADRYLGAAGLLAGRAKGLNGSIEDIGRARDRMTDRLADVERRYRAQFAALDAMVGRMNVTSNYLTQQLAQLASLNQQ